MWVGIAMFVMGCWCGLFVAAICRAASLEDSYWQQHYDRNCKRRNI